MRVALLQKNFHSNSVGLLSGLAARGHEVFNIVQYTTGSKTGSASVEVPTVGVPYGRLSQALLGKRRKNLDLRGFPALRVLIRELKAFRPDVVIAKEPRIAALLGAAIGRSLGAQTVLMWDKPKTAKKFLLLSTVGRPLLPRIKFHMGHFGDIDADVSLGLIGSSRLLPYPVATGPDPEPRLQQLESDEDRAVRIVTVGSLNNRRKRNAMLLDALERSGVHESVELTFVGLGDTSSRDFVAIREREAALGWPASKILLNLAHPEVLSELRHHDLFILPSRNEPFGVVVPEAMSQGLAVICSDTTGARVCFENGVSGFVFPTDSVAVLAQQIAELVHDRQRLSEMSRAAYRRAAEELSPEVWAERFERLLAEGHRSR